MEKGSSSTPENSVSEGVGEQIDQLPKVPTKEHAEGPFEGVVWRAHKGTSWRTRQGASVGLS